MIRSTFSTIANTPLTENFVTPLSERFGKINAIALTVFSAIALLYLIFRNCCTKQKPYQIPQSNSSLISPYPESKHPENPKQSFSKNKDPDQSLPKKDSTPQSNLLDEELARLLQTQLHSEDEEDSHPGSRLDLASLDPHPLAYDFFSDGWDYFAPPNEFGKKVKARLN